MPKVVICVVPGWAAGGGHSLHVVCDLTLASAEHARFKQTDADVASFDGGYGSAYLARQIGQKFAREIFFLGREYSAADAHRMGAVNAVVPHAELEATALQWAAEINAKSPTAQRMLKYAFNLVDDGLVGQQVFAGEATRLAYVTDEAAEGRDAFLEKRAPGLVRTRPTTTDRGGAPSSAIVAERPIRGRGRAGLSDLAGREHPGGCGTDSSAVASSGRSSSTAVITLAQLAEQRRRAGRRRQDRVFAGGLLIALDRGASTPPAVRDSERSQMAGLPCARPDAVRRLRRAGSPARRRLAAWRTRRS